jgi:hypothetical protein
MRWVSDAPQQIEPSRMPVPIGPFVRRGAIASPSAAGSATLHVFTVVCVRHAKEPTGPVGASCFPYICVVWCVCINTGILCKCGVR